MDSFFDCLANFCETGNQSILFKASAFIFGADDLVTVCDADDHSRHKYRVFLASTGRTVHHTFLFVMFHRLTTASTETAVTIPEPELISGDHCEREILWLHITEFAVFMEIIAWQQSSVQTRNQVKTFLVNREKINIIFAKICSFAFQLVKAWKCDNIGAVLFAEKTLSIFVEQNDTVFVRGDRFIFIVISVRGNILNHKKSSFGCLTCICRNTGRKI